MTRRNVLIIATCLTMVALALIGGLAAYIGQITPASSATITESAQGKNDDINTNIYPISPRKAALIALRATPGASLTETPSIVSFQGVIAYEVQLDRGIVYVDANNGAILYNGAKSSNQTPVSPDPIYTIL